MESAEHIRPYLPVMKPDIEKFTELFQSVIWFPSEINLVQDRADWECLSASEQHLLKRILAFFAVGDAYVLRNIPNFLACIQDTEIRRVYDMQAFHEHIHHKSYSIQLQALVPLTEQAELLASVTSSPKLVGITDWLAEHLGPITSLGERLVVFAFFEGVLFSGLFAMIQHFKEYNKLPGLTAFNEFIARDEGLHCYFACHLLTHHVEDRIPQLAVELIYAAGLGVTTAFINDAFDGTVIGLTPEHVTQYVKYMADQTLALSGYQPMFHVMNPLMYMDKLTLNGVLKTNFFEHRTSAYNRSVADNCDDWSD